MSKYSQYIQCPDVLAHLQLGDTLQANVMDHQAADRSCEGSLLSSTISDSLALYLQHPDASR